MDDPVMERARNLLERRTAVAMLGTAHPDGSPELCLLIAPQFIEGGRIAGGEEDEVGAGTFRNLRQNPKATLLVLDPIMDPRARDGVRIQCEFLGAEPAGEELDKLTTWLETFAPRRKVVRRLLFKVLEVTPYRPPSTGPVVLG